MPITIKNSAGGGVTLDSTTSNNETVNLPTGGGNLVTTTGATFTGNIVIATAGKGLALGGTGAANTLTDFETGSWTPVYQGAGGTSGGGYGAQAGTYTKIGQLVHLQAYVNATSKGTLTGSLKIGGFPFTVNPTNQSAGAIGYQIGYNLGSGHNLALWAYSGDFAYLYQAGGTSNSAGLTTGDTDNAIITAFSITYHTNQ